MGDYGITINFVRKDDYETQINSRLLDILLLLISFPVTDAWRTMVNSTIVGAWSGSINYYTLDD